MITGTNHFVSRDHAIKYYAPYRFTAEDVDRKITEGEIKIGEPPLKDGETSFLVDDKTRYAIDDGKP